MRVGLQVPSFTHDGGPQAIGPAFGATARRADEAGLDSLWVMDHFFQIALVGRTEEPMLEAYAALSFAAALTERITLGAMVTGVMHRHPGVLAKTVTTLDVLSGGRAWLGIGASWNAEESAGLGIPFPPLGERYEHLEDTLRVVRQMWRGEEAPFHGARHTLRRPLNSPAPVRRPHPPILVGGGGERRTLRLVARYADACNLFDTDALPHKLEVLREHCAAEGRDYAALEKTALTFLPGDAGVDQAVDTVGRLGRAGIDHVIVVQATGQELAELLGEAAAQVRPVAPAGR